MDATQIAETFGSDARVLQYDPNSKEYMTFNTTYSIIANKPFLLVTKMTKTTFDIDNVEVIEGDAATDTGIYYDFAGNYDENMVLEAGYMYLASGKVYSSRGKTTLKGFRAYFKPTSNTSSAKAVSLNVDGETTSIDNLSADFPTSTADIYNINGQKISDNRQQNLPKGVYIQNGKKYIIK